MKMPGFLSKPTKSDKPRGLFDRDVDSRTGWQKGFPIAQGPIKQELLSTLSLPIGLAQPRFSESSIAKVKSLLYQEAAPSQELLPALPCPVKPKMEPGVQEAGAPQQPPTPEEQAQQQAQQPDTVQRPRRAKCIKQPEQPATQS